MSDEETRKYIYNNFNLLETGQLLAIWQKNDRVEYTDLAFEVLRELLAERGCEIPIQGDPVTEHPLVREWRDLPAFLEKVDPIVESNTGSASEPQFFKPASVIRLQRWLNRIAIASVAINVIAMLVNAFTQYAPLFRAITAGYSPSGGDYLVLVFYILATIIACVVVYFALKALGYILKTILEIETASRKQPELRQEA